jgi:hypothetical protein
MNPHSKFVKIAAVAVAIVVTLSGCGSSNSIEGSPGSTAPIGDPQSGTPVSAAPTRDCFWAARSDANAFNVLYPDRSATYWVAALAIPPGGELRLEGRYPHARYMSFNLYNPRLEPIDALADVEIAPNPGSAQPFALNANRVAEPRDYAVRVVAGLRPDDPAQRSPNTLYSFLSAQDASQPSPVAIVIYRVYVEDAGLDLSGGVGVPDVVLTLASGQELRGTAACAALESLPLPNLTDALNALALPVDLTPNTGAFHHLQWLKFFDLPSSQANRFNATPLGPPLSGALGQSTANAGGFASNVHNNYVYAALSQTLGPVVAIAGRAPRTPRTRDSRAVMEDGDLRYLSFCTNDANSTRYFDCAFDEQVVRDALDRYVLVVSRASDRPANARPECGVTWLDWGPLTQSLLLYRHMLPKPEAAFPHAIQYIPGPPGANEEQVMGPYFPYGEHMDQAGFEALGCPVNPDAIPKLVAQP